MLKTKRKENNTDKIYPKEKTITTIFEESVNRYTNKIAIQCNDNCITYDELNKRANKIARNLQLLGITSGDFVAVLFERSINMMIAIIAILKTGAAYLPISIDCPKERANFILSDSKAKLLIIDEQSNNLNYPVKSLFFNELIENNDNSNLNYKFLSTNVAYVIYTSGSTGMPKGVMIRHYSVMNRLLWMSYQYKFSQNDIFLQKTPYTFDVSVWEIFLWFFVGARLCIYPQGQESNVEQLMKSIQNYKITVCHFVPSMLNAFLKFIKHKNYIKNLNSLNVVFSSGEILSYSTVINFNELLTKNNHTQLHNLYGPTETTVDVTYFDCTNYSSKSNIVPIGLPIWNTRIYILNKNLEECMDKEEGEIYISGDGVAKGYINNPELNKINFIDDPFNKGSIMYKTGDLGKWSNGQLLYIGRIDNQVKIRGNRIELEEIESCINEMPGILQSLVTVKLLKDSNKTLEAYYLSDMNIRDEEITKYLQYKLPPYMLPTEFHKVCNFIYTSSGKLDRKNSNLILIAQKENMNNNSLSDIQKKALIIIQNCVSNKNIDIDLKLTQAGINSITFIKIIIALEESFDFEFDDDKLTFTAFSSLHSMLDYVESNVK